jgi:hypothetical protein
MGYWLHHVTLPNWLHMGYWLHHVALPNWLHMGYWLHHVTWPNWLHRGYWLHHVTWPNWLHMGYWLHHVTWHNWLHMGYWLHHVTYIPLRNINFILLNSGRFKMVKYLQQVARQSSAAQGPFSVISESRVYISGGDSCNEGSPRRKFCIYTPCTHSPGHFLNCTFRQATGVALKSRMHTH